MENAGAYLTEHPDEARYTDSLATARVESGLRVVVDGPAGERLETDMPAGVGGAGSAPSPGWFLRAAVELLTGGPVEVREGMCQCRRQPSCLFRLSWPPTGADGA